MSGMKSCFRLEFNFKKAPHARPRLAKKYGCSEGSCVTDLKNHRRFPSHPDDDSSEV